MLTKEQLTRYQRQLLIDGWSNEAQEKLQNSTVFVAGAGGLGSPVLFYLAAAGAGCIRICDFDVVSLSNLNRQILHSSENIGVLKADSARKKLSELNPHVNIITLKDKITRKNISTLAGNPDIIIDCLDNFETRFILNRFSVESRIPMIHAGVRDFSGQVTFLSPPETPCFACFAPKKSLKETVPIAGATAGVIGSLQATEALKYLTGIGENLKNKLLFWDGFEMRFSTINISRNAKCKVCGKL